MCRRREGIQMRSVVTTRAFECQADMVQRRSAQRENIKNHLELQFVFLKLNHIMLKLNKLNPIFQIFMKKPG